MRGKITFKAGKLKVQTYLCLQWLDMVAGQQLEEISSAYDAYGGGEECTVKL